MVGIILIPLVVQTLGLVVEVGWWVRNEKLKVELKTNPYGGVFAAVGLPNPWFGRVCVVYTCYKPLVC